MDANQVAPLIAAATAAANAASKSGIQSSECWGHIIGLLPILGACLGGPAAPILLAAGMVAQLGAGIYTACRTKAKVNGLQLATAVAQAAAAQLPKPPQG